MSMGEMDTRTPRKKFEDLGAMLLRARGVVTVINTLRNSGAELYSRPGFVPPHGLDFLPLVSLPDGCVLRAITHDKWGDTHWYRVEQDQPVIHAEIGYESRPAGWYKGNSFSDC